MSHLFMTGATGLLGSHLMADLLRAGIPLAVLVRSRPGETSRQRIESILQEQETAHGVALPRPVVLEGDVSLEHCGLDSERLAWVRRSCCRVLHSGASLQFVGKDRRGDPWRTNVDGTRHVVNLARASGIDDFWHISTAYVCGLAPGPIAEGPSTATHGFRNDYEQSKHEAESLVRGAEWLRAPTFLRPAVIVGHSRTGGTTTYHGLMAMLHLMTVIVRNTPPDADGFRRIPLRLAVTGDERRNLVPVDWVAETMATLLATPSARGRAYHLAPERPITIREIIDFTSSYLNSGGVSFVGPNPPDDLSPLEQAAYGGKGLYEPYEHTDPLFSMDNLRSVPGVMPCPVIDEAMIHRFLAFGDEDRWGKRRRKVVEVPCWAEDLLRELVAQGGDHAIVSLARLVAGGAALTPPTAVGIECLGSGGGAWTISRTIDGSVSLSMGRPVSGGPVVELDVERLSRYQKLCLSVIDREVIPQRKPSVALVRRENAAAG